MDNKISQEKILIIIAIILCAFIIGYNAFFVPEISIPTVVYVDNYDKDKETLAGTNSDVNLKQESDDDNVSIDLSNGVNINTATVDELVEELDGIGPEIAQRIVDYRENVSEFKYKQDIKNVNGVGDGIYEKIENNIIV